MVERAGRLRYPPLELVVAAVRFQPVEALSQWITALQGDLRERLPVFHKVRQVIGPQNGILEVDPDTFDANDQNSTWLFANADHSFMVQLGRNFISFQTRSYTTFGAFSQEANFALDMLLKHASYLDVNFMGIRYLDFLQPEQGRLLKDFVPAELLPMEPYAEGVTTIGGLSATQFEVNGDRLLVRLWTGPDQTRIPEDLFGVHLLTQDLTKLSDSGALMVPMLGPGEAMLDMDSVSLLASRRASKEEILSTLDRLHTTSNDFFRNQLGEAAFKQWQGVAS